MSMYFFAENFPDSVGLSIVDWIAVIISWGFQLVVLGSMVG